MLLRKGFDLRIIEEFYHVYYVKVYALLQIVANQTAL